MLTDLYPMVQLLNGTYSPVIVPSPWGPSRPDQIMVLKGRNRLGYDPERIHEPTMERRPLI